MVLEKHLRVDGRVTDRESPSASTAHPSAPGTDPLPGPAAGKPPDLKSCPSPFSIWIALVQPSPYLLVPDARSTLPHAAEHNRPGAGGGPWSLQGSCLAPGLLERLQSLHQPSGGHRMAQDFVFPINFMSNCCL